MASSCSVPSFSLIVLATRKSQVSACGVIVSTAYVAQVLPFQNWMCGFCDRISGAKLSTGSCRDAALCTADGADSGTGRSTPASR